MSNYLKHMRVIGNHKAFDRRVSYLKHNYTPYLKHVQGSNKKVLEIGPGNGELLKVLNDQGITKIDILDNDKAVLDFCKKTYRLDQVKLSQSTTPVKNLKTKYDLIVLTQVFEHFKKDSYITWIRGLYKVLKPGGYIVITVPNGANPLSGTERYGDLQHENIFTVFSLKELITFSNLKNNSYIIKGFNIPPTNIINLVRLGLQKILHQIFILLMIINGAIYQTLMTPNITLVIKKDK